MLGTAFFQNAGRGRGCLAPYFLGNVKFSVYIHKVSFNFQFGHRLEDKVPPPHSQKTNGVIRVGEYLSF